MSENNNKPRATASIAIYLDFGDAKESLAKEQTVWASMMDFLRLLNDIGADVTSYELEVNRISDEEDSITNNWE